MYRTRYAITNIEQVTIDILKDHGKRSLSVRQKNIFTIRIIHVGEHGTLTKANMICHIVINGKRVTPKRKHIFVWVEEIIFKNKIGYQERQQNNTRWPN